MPCRASYILSAFLLLVPAQPNAKDVHFQWTDPAPTKGKTSYYYVRGEQVPDVEGATGELVWASPLWIQVQ